MSRRPEPSPGDPRAGAWFVLGLGVWCGLLLGLGEAALIALRRFQSDRLLFVSSDIYWMAPLAEALLFGLIGLLLLLGSAVVRGGMPWYRVFGVYLFLMILTALLRFGMFHPVASMLLAAGIAFQGGRLARRWIPWIPRLAIRTIPVLLIVELLLGGWILLSRRLAERRDLASIPAASTDALNVIFLILDTVRARELGVYGYERPTTPELDRWSRRGVRFEHAFSTASWTLPSHAALFTGRQPQELHANWLQPLDTQWPTLAETLRNAGYRTGGFVANLEYTSRESGLARGFATYRDYPISPGQLVLSSEILRQLTGARWVRRLAGSEERLNRRSAEAINGSFLDWLDRAPDRPMFAFLNYYDAHTPYNPPAEFTALFRTPGASPNPFPDRETPDSGAIYPDAELQGARDLYDAGIRYLDTQIGRLLSELERRGVLERSIIVITSDHGEEFAEHGFLGHGNTLYREVLEVPLLILGPGRVPEGRVIPSPASLSALPATIVDLLALPGKDTFPGRSLASAWTPADSAPDSLDLVLSLLRGTPGKPRWIPTGRGDIYSAVFGQSHYIVDGTGAEELYDLADHLERTNLVTESGRESEVARFRDIVATMRTDSRPAGQR